MIHRYIRTNKLLYKIGKIESPRCTFCEMYSESIHHLFYDCIISNNVWLSIQDAWKNINDIKINLGAYNIILGYKIHIHKESCINNAVNLIILDGQF